MLEDFFNIMRGLWVGYCVKASLQRRVELLSFPCCFQDPYDTVIPLLNPWRISRMTKLGYRWAVMAATVLLLTSPIWSTPFAADDTSIIAQSADYFPDQIGNIW